MSTNFDKQNESTEQTENENTHENIIGTGFRGEQTRTLLNYVKFYAKA